MYFFLLLEAWMWHTKEHFSVKKNFVGNNFRSLSLSTGLLWTITYRCVRHRTRLFTSFVCSDIDFGKCFDYTCTIWLNSRLTKAVADMILGQPEAPTTNFTHPSGSTTMLGHIEDNGLLPGLMKFAGDAG